ncbi:MAG: hypothetical protein ACI85V_000517 [bacterium]|jgi:hypothetical protein
MDWSAAPSGKRSHRKVYSDAAIQACLRVKVLFCLPLRQATGFVESAVRNASEAGDGLCRKPVEVGQPWLEVPDFSTLCLHQKTLSIAIPYQGSKNPLNLIIPSCALLRNTLPGNGQYRYQKPLSVTSCGRACRAAEGEGELERAQALLSCM